jgi:hypothetical protein
MNVTTLLEKIAGKQRLREQARVNDFRTLVKMIATGHEPDVEQVDSILSESGKSIDDLRCLVELYQARVALRKQFDELPRLEAERKDIIEKINKADEALDAAERKHEEVTGPLRGRLEFVGRAMEESTRARQLLWDNCADDKLRSRLIDLESQWADSNGQIAKLRQIVNHLRACAKSDNVEASRSPDSGRVRELTERASSREAKAAEREAELAEQLKRYEDLEKQIQQVRDAMLEP